MYLLKKNHLQVDPRSSSLCCSRAKCTYFISQGENANKTKERKPEALREGFTFEHAYF